MAAGERQFEPLHGILGKGIAIVIVRFSPNGSSSPTLTADQKQGGVKSVTRTDVGKYTVVLDQKYAAIVGAFGGARTNATALNTVDIVGTPDLTAAAGATIPIVVSQGGSAADLAANANTVVSLILFLSKSTLTTS